MQSTFVDVRDVGVFRLLERVLAVFRLSRRLEMLSFCDFSNVRDGSNVPPYESSSTFAKLQNHKGWAIGKKLITNVCSFVVRDSGMQLHHSPYFALSTYGSFIIIVIFTWPFLPVFWISLNIVSRRLERLINLSKKRM